MRARGATTRASKLLDCGTLRSRERWPRDLGLPEGTPVTVLERLRVVDGQVVGYEIHYLPRQIGEALTSDEVHNQPLVPAVRRSWERHGRSWHCV